MTQWWLQAHERGWVVIVADPFGDPGSPHRHMLGLSKKFLKNADTIMIVGHSFVSPPLPRAAARASMTRARSDSPELTLPPLPCPPNSG